MVSPDAPVATSTLVGITQELLHDGRTMDALGVYWLAGTCGCGSGSAGHAIVTVRPGLQLHYCSTCGRPRAPNRARVLGDQAWSAGDVAVLDGELVVVVGAPGPTGALRVRLLDGEPEHHTHAALLNVEAP